MRRKDGALEVRLNSGDGSLHPLVGWLTNYLMFDHERGAITIDRVSSLGDGGWLRDDDVVDSRGFKLTEMNRVVPRSDLERFSPAPALEQVPINATQAFLRGDREYLFSWKALVVDMPNYELLFDLPCFEPFDNGEPDTDNDVIRARFAAAGAVGSALILDSLSEEDLGEILRTAHSSSRPFRKFI